MFLFLRDFRSLKAAAEQYRQPREPACGNHVLVSSRSSTELKPGLSARRSWTKILGTVAETPEVIGASFCHVHKESSGKCN